MHLQRQGDEHSGSGNGGASLLKKRLRRSPSLAGHTLGPPTTLTACHGCLRGPGSFVFVTICRSSAGIKQRQVVYFPRNPRMLQETFHLRPNCDGSATYCERLLPKARSRTKRRPIRQASSDSLCRRQIVTPLAEGAIFHTIEYRKTNLLNEYF